MLAAGAVLWMLPWLLTGSALGFGSLWARSYVFLTQTALVTFGGAYAVLGYVTRHLVEDFGWLTAAQSVAGLALAETTPGPLVIVLQFMGFMAGWNQSAPLPAPVSALLASLLAIAAAVLVLLRSRLGLPWILALAAGAGLACQLLGLA